ncbi:CHAT domain-containing protein [Myxococcus stipitatus]|uniref:CHAT domain-containing protein n=1 Tax=Myxococcus stipitatus TaxID=83455 RepID=UPI001F2F384F|nr:CHAT domain-containing protein [Myxococcus stipitatus]MCE9668143.1 CHAT domain-containing protein [Myxococcus stipitatus]
MSRDCDGLPLFLAEQLTPDEHARFREHLLHCYVCERDFHEAMQLEMLAQMSMDPETRGPETEARAVAPVPPEPRRGWRQAVARGKRFVLPAMLLLLAPSGEPAHDPSMEWLDPAWPQRTLESRVSYPAADAHHRAFVATRSAEGAGGAMKTLSVQRLAPLDERGDWHGIATAHLLYGAPGQARAYLHQLPPSADRDSDLAVLELEQARQMRDLDARKPHLDSALTLLAGALARASEHPQALWNQGLVLRELGLSLRAAQSFGEVRRLNEPGWSEEAAEREAALRESTLARAKSWKEAFALGRGLAIGEEVELPLELAREHPGILRLYFYEALRTASTRERVLWLLPLARALDASYGGQVLEDAVHRTALRDFAARGPVAREYARLIRDERRPEGEVMEVLRRSGEEDLYLGALVRASTQGLRVDSEALIRLASASEDPWMHILAERERVLVDQRAGRWAKAEERLLKSLTRCDAEGLVYRCLGLERQLADLYLELHRPADAFPHAWRGWTRAVEAREWDFELSFLLELADVARYQHAFASARAYLEEALARTPDDCARRAHVHQNLALLSWQTFQPDQARQWLERVTACDVPLGLTGVGVLTELARRERRPDDEPRLRRTLAELRQGVSSPGREALLLVMEGQFTLRQSREAGRALLQQGLFLAEQTPDSTDARKALAAAHSTLISEAARQGSWTEALELLRQEQGLQRVPSSCLLAVSVDHEQTFALARGPSRGGPSGQQVGHYDELRGGPLGEDATGLVPRALLKVLQGCEHVDVLARPPVQGMPGLLPDDVAWSYRVGHSFHAPSARAGPATHLVVRNVATPASLQLPELGALAPPRLPDPWRVELKGSAATPSNVLAAMSEASEVELHVHGKYSSALSDASLLVLAPEPDGSYALTAELVRQARLLHAPLVLLAACGAARKAPYLHESYSLPMAFIEAGASAVLASSLDIPDSAGAFFEKVRERIRAGVRPSVALRDARAQWARESPGDQRWLPHVLLFE